MSTSPRPEPTIVGVATGTPDGGVAIVRVSGPAAPTIAAALVGALPPPRLLARRQVHDAAAGPGDDALVVWMPGPRSLTGEDVVELHVHAGALNVSRIVAALLQHGAVAAGPGEFTRRAFEHGRLNLEQAEGIAALIAARTAAGVEQARRLIAGELGREVAALCAAVGELRAEIEANLDFPEDVAAGDVERWCEELRAHEATTRRWLHGFTAGQRARERPRVVIAGPPNAGKSALFNALLGRGRAIVSPTPGTTRDYVEAELQLGGREVVIVDTAGLRGRATDPVEDEGIARSHEQMAGAELVLWVEPADTPPGTDRPRDEAKASAQGTSDEATNASAVGSRLPAQGTSDESRLPARGASDGAMDASVTGSLLADTGGGVTKESTRGTSEGATNASVAEARLPVQGASDGATDASVEMGLPMQAEHPDVPPDAGSLLRVESKRDLGTRRASWLGVSAVTGAGLDALREAIAARVGEDAEAPWIGLARHRDRAAEAAEALSETRALLARAEPLELAAFQLAVAERRLAAITGRDALGPVGEEVLTRIFARFCIGK